MFKKFSNIENIIYLPTVPSTNSYLKQLAIDGAPEGTCVIADEQTGGRGRNQRHWYSPSKEGLYLSILLRPPLQVDLLYLFSLLGAVTVAQTISLLASQIKSSDTIDIKWPNDVLINNKKVSGILSEASFSDGQLTYIVIGIGINLYQQSFPTELTYKATSLSIEFPTQNWTKNFIIETLLSTLNKNYFELKQNPQSIITKWSTLSSFAHGKQIEINLPSSTIAGITRGLRSDGAIAIETNNGKIEYILEGEVNTN